jgi:ABC-type uncharacterized transport system involved in gliding motility auxiliary subunit
MSERKDNIITIIIASIAFILCIVIANNFFGNVRLDLTSNKIYTLSDGTKKILANIDDKIVVKFFYSEQAASSMPEIHNYANRIKGLLKQYTKLSERKIEIELIDPKSFSEEEDRALEFGIQPIPLSQNSNQNVYFGAVFLGSTDEIITIPIFDPARESFLEFDLTKTIYELNNPKSFKIGLLSWIPSANEYIIFEQLRKQYEIKQLDTKIKQIPNDIDILFVVHPANIDANTEYAIDQFVLKGGKTIVFVDPNSELASIEPKDSNLPSLFNNWGIEFSKEQVIEDKKNALQVNVPSKTRSINNLVWLGLKKEDTNREEIITANLNKVNFITTGYFQDKNNDNGLNLIPLVRSSNESMVISADKIRFLKDPEILFRDFKSTNQSYILAAALTGKAHSAFPNKKDNKDHLDQSTDNINVILVADTDMLNDVFWIQKQRMYEKDIEVQISDNGPFVFNIVDVFSGSNDLITLRSRRVIERPFELVDNIKNEANAKFLVEEDRLKDKLLKIQEDLEMLKKSDSSNNLIDETQRSLILKAQEELLTTRKELRRVQHNLNTEIATIETIIRIINISILPFIIIVLSFIVPARLRKNKF